MIYISEDANKELLKYLENCGREYLMVSGIDTVDPAIMKHPDVYMCKLGAEDSAPLFIGDPGRLERKYPKDCLYNAVCIGKYLICSRKAASAELVEAAKNYIGPEMILIDVPQGYAKCNIAVINNDHLITEDDGIFKALQAYPDISCLKIHGGSVALPGYKYGFIGGACGRVGKEILFNGDISLHPDYAEIKAFIEDCGLAVRGFSGILTDIGSIISAL